MRVELTKSARQWLDEIYDFHAAFSTDVASKVVAGIISRCRELTIFPESGMKVAKYADYNVRFVLYKKYRIVYHIINPEHINIIGIFHSSMNYERHIDIK